MPVHPVTAFVSAVVTGESLPARCVAGRVFLNHGAVMAGIRRVARCESCGDEFEGVNATQCYACRRGLYVPTPEEIRERTEAIKHGWSESEERNRRGVTGYEDTDYVIPIGVKVG